MTPKEVEKLASSPIEIHFMDITDTPNLEKGKVPQVSKIPNEPRHQRIIQPLLTKLSVEGLKKHLEKLTSYHTRYYTSQTGRQAAEWIYSYYKEIVSKLPSERQKLFETKFFNHTWLQPSVITTIKGKSDEIVVIGAHEDSINGATGRSPGADDNGSGTSTVLEVFKVIAESNVIPEKTIEIHNYAAEEVGLRGSRDIAQAYKNSGKKVFSMLNMDMTGYNNRQNTVGIATDYTNSELTSFLRKVVDAYTKLSKADIRCNYACSDHASFTSAGYRSSHIFEAAPLSNMNRNIHTARDTIEILDLPRAVELIKVALSFTLELAL